MSFQAPETILFELEQLRENIMNRIEAFRNNMFPVPEPVIIKDTQIIQGGRVVNTTNVQNRVAILAAEELNDQINTKIKRSNAELAEVNFQISKIIKNIGFTINLPSEISNPEPIILSQQIETTQPTQISPTSNNLNPLVIPAIILGVLVL